MSRTDNYSTADETVSAKRGVAITLSDSVNFPNGISRGIHAKVGGTVVVVWQDDSTSEHTLLTGVDYGYQAKRINSTGTDVTVSLTALY